MAEFSEKLESEKICFVDCHAHISAKDFSGKKHCVTVAECRGLFGPRHSHGRGIKL